MRYFALSLVPLLTRGCEYWKISNSESNILVFDYSNESDSVCLKLLVKNRTCCQTSEYSSSNWNEVRITPTIFFLDNCSKNRVHTDAAYYPAANSMRGTEGSGKCSKPCPEAPSRRSWLVRSCHPSHVLMFCSFLCCFIINCKRQFSLSYDLMVIETIC